MKRGHAFYRPSTAFGWFLSAILAASLVAALPASRAAGSARACVGGTLYVAAHVDDPLLFMLPDLDRDIAAHRCVQVVILTAGDAGRPQAYWQSREAGLAQALALLAGQPDRWRKSDLGIQGHPTLLATLRGDPRLGVMFMRLPDGRSDGAGFAGRGSLKMLWERAIQAISSLDVSPPSVVYRPSTYTRADLIGALQWLLRRFRPSKIGAQDYVGSVDGTGDHSDHRAGAQFVVAAARSYARRATLVGYLDYQILNYPPNVSGRDAARKQAAWFAYLPHDSVLKLSGTCVTVTSCLSPGNYGNYWSRQYRISRSIQLPAPH